MEQERRYSARHRIELPVYIRYGRRPFQGACAIELSIAGMFLSVHALTLPVGTPVELEFSGLGRHWLLPAVVVHGDNSGVGVMFREPQPELFQGMIADTVMPPPAVSRFASGATSRT
jgi:hypothetical protein